MAKTTTIAGNTFLFTGKLTEFTREEAEAHVEAEGGKVISGVSNKLNYLVVGEDAGSKLAKAEALGTVTILHEKEFLDLMKPSSIATSKEKTEKPKAMIGKNKLDVKTAKKSISEYVNLDEFDYLDLKAAAILAAQDSSLYLDGIKYLDVDSAKALAKHKGENLLSLNRLEDLDAKTAEALATHNGPLSLNSITSLTDHALRALAACNFDISLDGLVELEDASALKDHSGSLSLLGLRVISDKVADQLSNHKGSLDLAYDYSDTLTSLTPSIAKLLVKHNQDTEITFEALELMSIDAAKELAKHNASISLGMKVINNDLLVILSKVYLKINNVTTLSPEQFKIISTFKKGVTINSIKSIDSNDAKNLVKVGNKLQLLGLETISDEVAKILADFKGELHLGCKTLSEKSAEFLGGIKRKSGKNELYLPNIEKTEDIEGRGVQFLSKEGINILKSYPKLDFNAERVVGICYALKGGLDYAWDINSATWDAVREDNEEFATFREIAKIRQFYSKDWVQHFPESLKSSLDFYTQLADACKEIPIEFIKLADKKIRANKELMQSFLESYQGIECLLEFADEKLQNDKEFVIQAVKASANNFEFASDKMRNDQDVVNCLLQLENSAYQIQYASDRYKSNKEIARQVLLNSGDALEYFSENIKNDKELVKIAVDNSSSAIQYASNELLMDMQFLLTLNRFDLNSVPKKFFTDKDFFIGLIDRIYQNFLLTDNGLDSNESTLLIETLKKLKIEKQTYKILLILSDEFVSEIPKEFQNDIEIAKILIIKDVSNLENLPATVRKNDEIKSLFKHLESNDFKGMNEENLALIVRYSGYGIINSENVKLFAKAIKNLDDAKRLVKRETSSYTYLSQDMKKDKIVSEIAISVGYADEGENFKSLPKILLDDKQFITNLLEKSPSILKYLPETYKKDKDVALKVLNKDIRCFEFIDKSLQSYSELIELVISKGNDSELECLEMVNDSIKAQENFAFRLAKKGYILKAYRGNREIVIEALKQNKFANINSVTKKGEVNLWSNDLEVALLAKYYGSEVITEESPLYNRPNLIAVKFLEQISVTNADNLDVDAIEFIRASGYSCFIDNQIPRQDFEEENDYDDDDDSNEDSDED
jgi:hypothetical protein